MVKLKWHLILIPLFLAIIFTVSGAQFRFVQTHKIVKEVECFTCHKQEFENILNGTHITRMPPNQTRFVDDYYMNYADGSTDFIKDLCYTCHLSQQHYEEFALSDPYIFHNSTSNQSEAIYNHTYYWRGGNYLDQVVGSRNNTIKVAVFISDIQPVERGVNLTIKIDLANFSNHQNGQTHFENSSLIYSGQEASLTTPQVYGDYFNVTISLDGQWTNASINITIDGTNKEVTPVLIDTNVTGEHKFPANLKDYGYPYFHTVGTYEYRRLDGIWLDFRNNGVANISAFEGFQTSTDSAWINRSSCASEDAMCHVNQKITYLGIKEGLQSLNYTSSAGFYKHNMPYATTEQCRICHLTTWVK